MKTEINASRIESLDGFRAISISMVIISHLKIGNLNSFIDLGNLGVRIFFIISAFLISNIIIKQKAKGERWNGLKIFYLRRFLRIVPALWLYFIVAIIILDLYNLFEFSQFWRAFLFIENYHPRSMWTIGQWPFGHIWSLSVEEQFYLIFAPLLFYLSTKKFVRFLLVIILIAPLIRIGFWFFKFPEIMQGSVHRSFETVMDALAFGSLAYFYNAKITNGKYFDYISRPLIVFLLILLIQSLNSSQAVVLMGYMPRFIYNSLGITLQCILICGLITRYSSGKDKNTFVWGILNYKIMVSIGLMSYSIYLWQQIWLYPTLNIPFYISIPGIFFSAFISYRFVENPIINNREIILKKINARN